MLSSIQNSLTFRTVVLAVLVTLESCGQQTRPEKASINGLALEGPSQVMSATEFVALRETGANWVCLMPYAYSKSGETHIAHGEAGWQWWGEKEEGVRASIEMAKAAGLQVMIKPHLWIGHGDFTGDLDFDTAEQWVAWERSYSDYILLYARIAEEYDVPLLCIGTELKTSVTTRTDFWQQLISDIRTVYGGQLTYAGNWDSYKDFPHWEQLDYIGVDAYFPLIDAPTPAVEDLIIAWQVWEVELKALSELHDRPVIFTEYGYRSIESPAIRPWETAHGRQIDQQAQANALSALYQSVWTRPWMQGGFLWKWHADSHLDVDRHADRFTPQGKAAEAVMRSAYGAE